MVKTVTTFGLLCQVCGLSHREAADLFDVRLNTAQRWCTGRMRAPDGVLQELVELSLQIDEAADEAVGLMERVAEEAESMPQAIELSLVTTDSEARQLGWPCAGVVRAVCALTVARGMAEGYEFALGDDQLRGIRTKN